MCVIDLFENKIEPPLDFYPLKNAPNSIHATSRQFRHPPKARRQRSTPRLELPAAVALSRTEIKTETCPNRIFPLPAPSAAGKADDDDDSRQLRVILMRARARAKKSSRFQFSRAQIGTSRRNSLPPARGG